jgi:hypothetical protein
MGSSQHLRQQACKSARIAQSLIDQQKMQFYRNGLLDQQRQLERSGVSPGSERSREIQQQLNPPGSR